MHLGLGPIVYLNYCVCPRLSHRNKTDRKKIKRKEVKGTFPGRTLQNVISGVDQPGSQTERAAPPHSALHVTLNPTSVSNKNVFIK